MTNEVQSSPALLLPIGQFFGFFFPTPGSTEHLNNVRAGTHINNIDDQHFAIWGTMHGTPTPDQRTPWTRRSVRNIIANLPTNAPSNPAASIDPTHIDSLIDDLIAQKLAIEIVPGTDGAQLFARTHHLGVRMLGLGNDANQPWQYTIGFFDNPVIGVSRAVYSLWELAAYEATLWDACETLAREERDAGGDEPELTDPSHVLTSFYGNLHQLLSVSVVYLDPVR
jgi:hypothetical protein